MAMIKRVYLLMGLSILAVVVSHAAGWGQIAMFYWADRYRPVIAPNFDQLGSPAYYLLLVIRQLAVWAVPAFLFASGFFVAYAARGSRPVLGWKMVRVRLINLLIPYLIWSMMCFVGDAIDGITYAPAEYAARLIRGGADGPYFYVPLLCQFYLIAPLIVPAAQTRSALLLLVSALMQGGALGFQYLVFWQIIGPEHPLLFGVTAPWLPLWWLFYFPLGMTACFHSEKFQNWLRRRRLIILTGTVVLAGLAMAEPEIIYRITGIEWRFVPLTIATSLYSVFFVLCFMAFAEVPVPFSNFVHQMGRRSYAIYLLHMKVMAFSAKSIRQVMPWMLAHQAPLFMPIILALGLGLPLLFMSLVSKSDNLRRSYHYLFG